MKLKTRLMGLEKDNSRLQKLLEADGGSKNFLPSPNNPLAMMRNRDAGVKAMFRNLKQEYEELQTQHETLKSSIKFTSIREVEIERDAFGTESQRLRQMLEEEQGKLQSLLRSLQGASSLEARTSALHEKNAVLLRENHELQDRLKKYEESSVKANRLSETEKHLNRLLFNSRRVIHEKEKEIEHLKTQLSVQSTLNKTQQKFVQASTAMKPSRLKVVIEDNPRSQAKEVGKPEGKLELPKKPESAGNSQERSRKGMREAGRANPASHYDRKEQTRSLPKASELAKAECKNCVRKDKEMAQLKEKIARLESRGEDKGEKVISDRLLNENLKAGSAEEIKEVSRYLSLRLKAHRLRREDSQKYLGGGEGEIRVLELVESLLIEPFCLVNRRYLQVVLAELATDGKGGKYAETDVLPQQKILLNYRRFIPAFELYSQEKEEEMFVQIAQLITNYHQQILSALTARRNGEGTISETDFVGFFKEIELEQPYIDFVVMQLILDSVDMLHINYFAMFEIFYMPAVKNKFAVDNSRVVHEEDEEFEESKSQFEPQQISHEPKHPHSPHEDAAKQPQVEGYSPQNDLDQPSSDEYEHEAEEDQPSHVEGKHRPGKDEPHRHKDHPPPPSQEQLHPSNTQLPPSKQQVLPSHNQLHLHKDHLPTSQALSDRNISLKSPPLPNNPTDKTRTFSSQSLGIASTSSSKTPPTKGGNISHGQSSVTASTPSKESIDEYDEAFEEEKMNEDEALKFM